MKRTYITSLFFFFIALMIGSCRNSEQTAQPPTITPQEVHEIIQRDAANILLLDVRTPEEYNSQTGHLKDAILIPVQELEQRINELESHKEKTIIAICRSGNRSGKATTLLNDRGFRAVNMVGGMIRWNEELRPTILEDQR